jgi:protein involved in polysaccharide export with SLBB domain
LIVLARAASRHILLPVVVSGAMFLAGACVYAQDPPVLETPQQTNERIRSLSANAKTVPHEYVIGNGDLLNIFVFDVPELSREVRVNQGGSISIPLVPVRFQVAGLTEIQAEQKIAELLEANGLVSHPEVGVTVKEHRSKPITIVGAVAHPMVFESDRNITLLEALAQAGGVSNDAGDTVIITRPRAARFEEITDPTTLTEPRAPGAGSPSGDQASTSTPSPNEKTGAPSPALSPFPSAAEMDHGTPPPPVADPKTANTGNSTTINLNELLEAGDTRNNLQLQGGEIVTVPHAGIVYVLGAVTKPGGFVLSNDRTQLTTLKVLSLAGGLTKIAKVGHAVIIRKDDQGKQTETEVDLRAILQRKSEDLTMRASDILYVPDDRTKEVLYQALQIGMAVGTAVAIYRVAYQ